jgi:hypothetical protein
MEKQERKSRIFLIFAFLLTLVSLGLLAAAMGSEFWVVADIALRGGSMSTAVPENSKGVSYAHHGLFSGEMLRTDVFAVPFRYDLTSESQFFFDFFFKIQKKNSALLFCIF